MSASLIAACSCSAAPRVSPEDQIYELSISTLRRRVARGGHLDRQPHGHSREQTHSLTDRQDPKDYEDLYCAITTRPELWLNDLVRMAETKFGVKGITHILRGRFLGALPPFEGLILRHPLPADAMRQFFQCIVKDWITRSLEEEV